jgi:hypothetical protein
MHWGRETLALALAVQNLVWGMTQPFAGMIADKYGTGRVVIGGALLYALGLAWMAHPVNELTFVLASGVLIGTGLSGVTFSVIAGALGRAFPPEKRSMALGISAAAGSFGQFALLPLTQWLLSNVGWAGALITMACVALAIAPIAAVLVERRIAHVHAFKQSARQAFSEALGHRSYVLPTVGFFVCGFRSCSSACTAGVSRRSRSPPTSPDVAGARRTVQYRRYVYDRLARRAIAEALHPVVHLFRARRDRGVRVRAAVGGICLHLRDGAWLAMAVHRAADECDRRAGLRRSLSSMLSGFTFFAPDRQLPRRVARRQAVRHDRQLRRRLVSRDRARHRRGLINLPIDEREIRERKAPAPA